MWKEYIFNNINWSHLIKLLPFQKREKRLEYIFIWSPLFEYLRALRIKQLAWDKNRKTHRRPNTLETANSSTLLCERNTQSGGLAEDFGRKHWGLSHLLPQRRVNDSKMLQNWRAHKSSLFLSLLLVLLLEGGWGRVIFLLTCSWSSSCTHVL